MNEIITFSIINKFVSFKTKIKLHKDMIRPTVLYGLLQKLAIFEKKVVRKIFGQKYIAQPACENDRPI